MPKKRQLILLGAVGLVIIFLIVFLKVGTRLGRKSTPQMAQQQATASSVPSAKSPTAWPNKPTNSRPSAPVQEKRFTDAFATPITFYGRVVDQHGDAVPQADVKIAANDKPLGGRPSEYALKTDDGGLFAITGIVGLTLAVEVSKPGYRVIPPADNKVTSSGLFDYGLSSNQGPHRASKEAPVVFTLHKQGTLEPLVRGGEKNFRIARDGSPLSISLDQGQTHQVILRCWNNNASRLEGQRQYDWRLEINVPNGGLIPRIDLLNFEAPQDGYFPTDTIDMPSSLPPGKWHGLEERSYFIRFNDGVFARAKLEMHAGGDHFVVWESFLNPKAGSRTLELNSEVTTSSR